MKLGVNNNVNPGTEKAALRLMAGGPSKINPPNSHPSNPIHPISRNSRIKKLGFDRNSESKTNSAKNRAQDFRKNRAHDFRKNTATRN